MSLKEKLLFAAASKTIDAVVNQIDKKTRSQKVVEKVSKPTTTNKKGVVAPAYEYMMKSKSICYIMEADSFTSFSLKGFKGKEKLDFNEYKGQYKIYDKDQTLQYVALEKEPGLTEELICRDLDRLFLYDSNGEIVGCAKEHLIALNVPLLEKEAKKCSVFLGSTKLCTIRHTISFGSDSFEMYESNYNLGYTNGTDFTIKQGKIIIAKIKRFRPTLKNLFPKSVVIECMNENDSATAILLAMTIDSLCSY